MPNNFRPEYVTFSINCCVLLYYVLEGKETGKIIYWLGAILVSVGLIKMRG